jgi:hypothetical protein
MQQVVTNSVVGVLTIVIVTSAGCATPETSSTRIRMQTLSSAGLDSCREIQLTRDRVLDRESGQPEREYEVLRIVVKPREHLNFERTVKQVELKYGLPRRPCHYENVEARSDESHQRIWFVQRDTGKIVATVDLATDATTGPDDEPPAWATPDGGRRLERAFD